MNRKFEKFVSTLVIAAMLLSVGAVLPVRAGTEGDVKMINLADETSEFIFNTDITSSGDTFNARIRFIPPATPVKVKGWQVVIQYNTTLLDGVKQTIPAGHILEEGDGTMPSFTADEDTGILMAANILTAADAYVNVSETKPMTDITFEITKDPGKLEILNCTLEFVITGTKVSYVIDQDGVKLDVNFFNGYYEFYWKVPEKYPWLEVVDPLGGNTITATEVGEALKIDIMARDFAKAWEIVGVEFSLYYNGSLISGIPPPSPPSPEYINGTFFEAFVDNGESLWYMVTNDYTPPHFYVGVLIAPPVGEEYVSPFPDGEGLLITLKVESLLQGVGVGNVLSCPLTLDDIVFFDKDGKEVEQWASVSGTYEIKPLVLGRKIDVYTQYPYPFGGQGLFEPSDMFQPQQTVRLYANVTYNEDGVQSKIVTFGVEHEEFEFYPKAITDEYGVAWVEFGLPWPCEDPEGRVFGVWDVIATVEIRNEVVNDTLKFKVNYLVESLAVESVEGSYLKYNGEMVFKVTYETEAMQTYNLTKTVTVFDTLDVPIATIVITETIGGASPWCTAKNYTETITLEIPKWAFVGEATVCANALSALPWVEGYAYCPEAHDTFDIALK